MEIEIYKTKITELLQNHTDQAKVSTLLAELSDDYTQVTAETIASKTTATKLLDDNEKLRQANMGLFLKIGEPTKKEDKQAPTDDTPKFDSLFDEKGNLK